MKTPHGHIIKVKTMAFVVRRCLKLSHINNKEPSRCWDVLFVRVHALTPDDKADRQLLRDEPGVSSLK